jgi:hypothetical protein
MYKHLESTSHGARSDVLDRHHDLEDLGDVATKQIHLETTMRCWPGFCNPNRGIRAHKKCRASS